MIVDVARQYGRDDLLDAYLAARGENYGDYLPESPRFNEALRTHYRGLLGGLEQLFGIKLSRAEIGGYDHAVLFLLFESTVRSLLALTTPWDGMAEAGLLHRRLEVTPVHARVMAASDRIWAHRADSLADHLDILDALLIVFLGERADDTFSAERLAALGVRLDPPTAADFDEA